MTGGTLQQRLQNNLRQRMTIERRWVSDLRRYQGLVTDSERMEAVEQGRSCIFVKYTRTKADAWAAQMNDMLFPADDRNWGIEPTPVPKLNQISKAIGQNGEPTPEAAQASQVLDEARRKAMERGIDDALTECDYPAEGRRCIRPRRRAGHWDFERPASRGVH